MWLYTSRLPHHLVDSQQHRALMRQRIGWFVCVRGNANREKHQNIRVALQRFPDLTRSQVQFYRLLRVSFNPFDGQFARKRFASRTIRQNDSPKLIRWPPH